MNSIVNINKYIFCVFAMFAVSVSAQAEILAEWGLGENVERHISSDRSYSWYRDQAGSGEDEGSNCGPAVATMAMTWFDLRHEEVSIEQAREDIRPNGSWWKPKDIMSYLKKYEVPYNKLEMSEDQGEWMAEIDRGQILVVNLNMKKMISSSGGEKRVGKFYSTIWPWWGHYIIVKGYAIVDGKTFLEVYDPYNYYRKYKSGQAKGQDRYYAFDEVYKASKGWWPYLISVSPSQK